MRVQEDAWRATWTISGPVLRHLSQVVNIICTIYGLSLMDRFGAMIHASAVADEVGRAVAVMGQSGMGKSSVAVRLLERGFDYISNDRLVLVPEPEGAIAAHGLPKLPRVNPGTLLDSEITRNVLAPEAQRRYRSMPPEELWQVEDKSDLEVEAVLGRKWLLQGDLACLLVLYWRPGNESLAFQRLTQGHALDELRKVAKNFGPFDLRLGNRKDTAFIETANRVPVYRVTGKPDPSRLAAELAEGRLAGLIESR